MRFFRATAIFFLLAGAGALTACQTTSQPAPLPGNLTIQTAPPTLSKKHAAFLGKWHGKWGGRLDGYLVVKEVTPPTASVVYAWGTSMNVKEQGWVERTATFEDDVLVVLLNEERGTKAVYTMNKNGTLSGVYTRSGSSPSTATLVCETC